MNQNFNQNFNNVQNADLPNIVPEVMPTYIRKRILMTDKYDRHYARYLQSNMFRNYVIEHDSVFNHTTVTEPDLYKAIHKERIFTIFENIHLDQVQNEIERYLQLEAINMGFVILMDDYGTAWIYIHEFENRFQQWEYNGVEEGPLSRSFFQ